MSRTMPYLKYLVRTERGGRRSNILGGEATKELADDDIFRQLRPYVIESQVGEVLQPELHARVVSTLRYVVSESCTHLIGLTIY
jgi:hypothetical protein